MSSTFAETHDDVGDPALYLRRLRANGIRLWVADGQLCYQAKRGVLSDEELTRLRQMKDGLLAELTRGAPAWPPASNQQQWLATLMQECPEWPQALSHALRLTGRTRVKALEESLQRVVRKHETLHTSLVDVGGTLCQQICTIPEFCLQVIPVAGVSREEKERNVRHLCRDLSEWPTDAPGSPMIRARLLELYEEEHILAVAIHRLAADCLSIGKVFRDLFDYYQDWTEERAADTECRTASDGAREADAASYQDYANWQHANASRWQEKHCAYWSQRLQGAERVRWPLDTDLEAADTSDFGGRVGLGSVVSLECSFGDTLSAGLREIGKRQQSLTALVLLSLYVRFISRWCGQSEFVLPFLIAGRRSEQEAVVGCFAHALYLRVSVFTGESFGELLKRVSNEFYRSMFHQDFGRIALQRPDLLQGTLCQWLSWHPSEVAGAQAQQPTRTLGFAVESLQLGDATMLANVPSALVDLDVSFFETTGDIGALAIYRNDRFSEKTMVQMMGELRLAAQQIVD